jgi:hypothetical protein
MASASLPELISVLKARRPITREEIMYVLADEGYSADQRMGWLKEILTQLTAQEASLPVEQRKELISEIKAILDVQLANDPMADDVL